MRLRPIPLMLLTACALPVLATPTAAPMPPAGNDAGIAAPAHGSPVINAAPVAPLPAPTFAPARPAVTPACAGMKAPYRSGLWEITSVSNNSMMPQPVTARIKRCVTERDTQNACGLNQLAGGRNRDCQIKDMRINGNTATWTMHCNNPQFIADGSGQSTFSADAYQGKFSMSATTQGSRMQMSTTFTGKRLGNCK